MTFNVYKRDYKPNTWFGVATYLNSLKHILETSCTGGIVIVEFLPIALPWMQEHVYNRIQSLIDA